jgi:hypothetical protein
MVKSLSLFRSNNREKFRFAKSKMNICCLLILRLLYYYMLLYLHVFISNVINKRRYNHLYWCINRTVDNNLRLNK